MKKLLTVMAAALLLMVASSAQAQYCGGNLVPNNDLGGNNRGWNVSCCPAGYRVQGVACADLPPDQDLLDGCSAVCRSIAKGNIMQPAYDFQRTPTVYQCDKTEVLAGIMCKDRNFEGKGDDDVSDGCTAVCQKPNTSNLRTVYSGDIAGTNRDPNQITVMLPTRVVGIACKDVNKGSSDRADSCTIITQ